MAVAFSFHVIASAFTASILFGCGPDNPVETPIADTTGEVKVNDNDNILVNDEMSNSIDQLNMNVLTGFTDELEKGAEPCNDPALNKAILDIKGSAEMQQLNAAMKQMDSVVKSEKRQVTLKSLTKNGMAVLDSLQAVVKKINTELKDFSCANFRTAKKNALKKAQDAVTNTQTVVNAAVDNNKIVQAAKAAKGEAQKEIAELKDAFAAVQHFLTGE